MHDGTEILAELMFEYKEFDTAVATLSANFIFLIIVPPKGKYISVLLLQQNVPFKQHFMTR
jgi:hypothetical protein